MKSCRNGRRNEYETTCLPDGGGGGSEEGGDGPAAPRQRILGEGRQPGLREMGEAAAAAADGAGHKRRRCREGRRSERRETEAAAAGAAGVELGVAIGKVRLRPEGGETRGRLWREGLWMVGERSQGPADDGASQGSPNRSEPDPVTAVTGLTGPARFRFRAVRNRPKFKF